MKTNIKFPKVPYTRREHFVIQRCAWLSDNEIQKAVIKGRFVLAWDGELNSDKQTPALGVLESVTMNSDGSRTYRITTEWGNEHLDYQNANVLREEWCPEVVITDEFGQYQVHKWIGLQERDGKVYATVTHCHDDLSTGVDPSTIILLDDCKVGLPEREEATNV